MEITLKDFLDANPNNTLDLDKVKKDPALRAELEAKGVKIAELEKIDVGGDGKLTSVQEKEALFRYVDSIDSNGPSKTIVPGPATAKLFAALGVVTPPPVNTEAIVKAALDRAQRMADAYGVQDVWKTPNPRIPGNANPDQTSYGGTKGHWKCNLFAMDCLYQAGFEVPSYSGSWYPLAVDMYKFCSGKNKVFDHIATVNISKLDASELDAKVKEALLKAKPGDLIIVDHTGSDAVDGGHCRVVVANNFAVDKTIKCAQAGSDSAVVEDETLSSFTSEEILYVLRPCRKRVENQPVSPPRP